MESSSAPVQAGAEPPEEQPVDALGVNVTGPFGFDALYEEVGPQDDFRSSRMVHRIGGHSGDRWSYVFTYSSISATASKGGNTTMLYANELGKGVFDIRIDGFFLPPQEFRDAHRRTMERLGVPFPEGDVEYADIRMVNC